MVEYVRMIVVGDRVRIKGLRSRVDLNGKTGICKGYDEETRRWKIVVEGNHAQFKVKATNLELAPCETHFGKTGKNLVAGNTIGQLSEGQLSEGQYFGSQTNDDHKIRNHSKRAERKRKRHSRDLSDSDDDDHCVGRRTPSKSKSMYYSEEFLEAALLHRSFRSDDDNARSHPRLTPIAKGSRRIVGIMGLHGSGTHALGAYISRYFDVDCEPQIGKKKDEGRLSLTHDFHIWKHTVPPLELPQIGINGSQLVMLFVVREVRSWMCSRAQSPYELFPIPRRKRPQGRVHWMFGKVKFETDTNHCNPKPDLEFESVPGLWLSVVQGYLNTILNGAERIGGRRNFTSIRYRLVRYEDIVLHPDKIVRSLEDFGLPRNSCKFEFIEHSVDKIGGGSTRKELSEKLSSGSWDGSRSNSMRHGPDAFTEPEAHQLRATMQNDPLQLVRVLDYSWP